MIEAITAGRREFMAFLPLMFFSAIATMRRGTAAETVLHTLDGEDIERLRLDFNASRNKVRLFFILSPT